MFDDFMARAALAGCGLALAAGPLGCFVIWRRMVYFGDATAHAALLGVALALAFSLSVFFGVLVVSLAMALLLSKLGDRLTEADAMLGVLSHGALAFGLVAATLSGGVRVDLMAYLLGDILIVGRQEVLLIWLGAALVLVLLAFRWSRLLTATLNPELAAASGIEPRREGLILALALAVVVAAALKIVGALLITAMLIIPAAAARLIMRSPEGMAIAAALIGVLSVLAGLWLSLLADTPSGPTMVCVAATIFAALKLGGSAWQR